MTEKEYEIRKKILNVRHKEAKLELELEKIQSKNIIKENKIGFNIE